jgi:UPF0755 protein
VKPVARVLLGIVLGLVVAGAALLWFGQRWITEGVERAGPHTAAIRIEVPTGASARAVLRRLQEAGAVADPDAAQWWLRLQGRDLRMRVGSYEIPAGASVREALRKIAAGEVVLESLTIVEGWTFAQMRRAVEAHPAIRVTLRDRSPDELMATLDLPGVHPEGRFFPDTYRFAAGTTDLELYRLAQRQLERALAAAWESRAPDLPVQSPQELLVLASIVEKETGQPAERARVAGVFVLRLRIGMRLQSDPTVIYGLGDAYDGDIRTRDLRGDTPYNTYTRNGLPPTPIALVGREALLATAQPNVTGDLFFVATGDADGGHVFTRTYPEHQAAVKRMLERQRARGLL